MNENSSLRDLVKSSQSVIESIIENNGELTPELEAQLQNIEINLPIKVDAYAVVIERMEMEAAYWKSKADTLRAVAKGCENVRERLKESLKLAAQQMGQDEILGHDVKFKISNSKPKLLIDEEQIDKAYTMQVTSTEIDKKRIEEDLKLGVPVRGASLQETKSIRQYVNKKV